MKKLMFALALVSLVFTSAQAQKQLGGEHNIEVNLTPFGESPIDGSTIKYRNFLDDDKALRITLMLRNSSDVYTYMQAGEQFEGVGDDDGSPQMHLGTSTTGFGLGVGYEMHFDGTDNLSPYFAFEGFFMMSKRKDYMEHWGPTTVDDMDDISQWNTWRLNNEQSVNQFGLNLMFGADYYFNDAIYVGFEAGIGLGVTSVGEHKISTDDVTAFNIQYNNENNSITNEDATASLDTYNGYMPFDAAAFDLYNNGDGLFGDFESDGNPFIALQGYENDGPHPNMLSGFNVGNVFNSAIRVGFLFD